MPTTLAVVVLEADTPTAITRRLGTDVLIGADARGSWLLLPDPDAPGGSAALKRAVGKTVAALGPTVAPRDAERSLRWARLALELINRGILPSEHPTRVADHLGTIMLLQDEEMARTLVAQRLAAVDRLPGPERDRLLETLAAWLAHQRHTPKIAAELHVHQQTVRYRIGKLRGLLGDELDTAEGRFELELALRARGALHRQSR